VGFAALAFAGDAMASGTGAAKHIPGRAVRAIFSDLDGTLVHFSQWFERHGVRIVTPADETLAAPKAVVADPAGEERICRVLPKSTMGLGYVSERTVELVDALREDGVRFVVITAARKSTLLERLELLPTCDVAVGECGTRIYYDGKLDMDWASRFEAVSGPLETDVPPEDRPQPLWRLCARMREAGLKVDTRSYFGCFRVDTQGSEEQAALVERFRAEMHASIACTMNLAKYDFYPAVCGKGNAVRYLQGKYDLRPEECAALFDDDNDLPMAAECCHRFLPALTSDSIVAAVKANPTWRVAKRCGQGVFAVEELLEFILAGGSETQGDTGDVASGQNGEGSETPVGMVGPPQ